ncbi:hypothetical protein GCM10025868_43910 [Angustibacter aerolatus]|uniref:Uncharacterized protein n=1 Tax=Angustibacter aerolatus TaxID=1162965 RepID=A0ABQ6JLL0_9ACTN|nr:hypothetical protein GCM10025868_43910 [Angustibacter aerolatus]
MSLAQALLALLGADGTAEVLRGDDGGGVHRPEVGELDATLLEDRLAGLPVLLHDVTTLPGDLVVRVHPRGGEDALHPRALALASCTGAGAAGRLGHVSSSSSSCVVAGAVLFVLIALIAQVVRVVRVVRCADGW